MSQSQSKFIFLSHDLTRKVELSLSRNRIRLIIAGLVCVFLSINVAIGVVASRVVTSRDNQALALENQRLREHISSFDNRLGMVSERLSTLAETDNMLRLMADLPVLDEDVRGVGVGGTAYNPVLEPAIPEVNDVFWTLDKLDREIELQRSSFEEIHEKFVSNAELLHHMPTLRPLDGGYLTSFFGVRPDPFTRKPTRHYGVDYSAPRGTQIFATAGGRVVFAQRFSAFGNFIVIEHGEGYETAYGHLNRIKVKKGQRVSKGDVIGTVGSTGRSTAPHLHYEVRIDGKAVNPLDFVFEESRSFPTMAHSGNRRYN